MTPGFDLKLWWVPLLAAGLAFLGAPFGALVWDDQIVATQQIHAFQSLGEILSPPAGIAQWSYFYYRPLVVLSYLLDVRLFGPGSALGPHAMNVLYHLLTTLSVWWLARRVLTAGDPASSPSGGLAALAAATLFAVHPLHTESVSWITGRSDLLATLLLVPGLHVSLRFRDEGALWQLLLSPVLFLLALLSKEVALTGLALLPLLWLTTPPCPAPGGQTPGAAARRFAWLAAGLSWLGAAAVWWSLRTGAGTLGAGFPAQILSHWASLLRGLAWYLQKLVWPLPQSNFVVWESVPSLGVSLVLLAGAALVLGGSVRLWQTRGSSVPFLGLVWTGIALVPSLCTTLAGFIEAPVAERYLYLPSVGFALALGGGLVLALSATKPVWGRRLLLGGVAAAGVFWLTLTVLRGAVWKDDATLWANAVAQSPGYALPLIEWGKARSRAGDDGAALNLFEQARAGRGSSATLAIAAYNKGLIFARRGQLGEAEDEFQASVSLDPQYAKGYYALGRVALDQALSEAFGTLEVRRAALDRAAQRLGQALQISPGFGDAWVQLARVYSNRGEPERALQAVLGGLRGEPAVLRRPEVALLARTLCQSLAASTATTSSGDCALVQDALDQQAFSGD